MLIAIIGPGSLSIDDLDAFDAPDQVIAVLRPGHRLPRRAIRDLARKMRVIEFLSEPASMTEILSEALTRFDHGIDGGPITVINRPATPRELAQAANDLGERAIEWTLGKSGDIAQVGIGQGIARNPLLSRFFRLLQETGIEDLRGLDLLQQTFKGLRA